MAMALSNAGLVGFMTRTSVRGLKHHTRRTARPLRAVERGNNERVGEGKDGDEIGKTKSAKGKNNAVSRKSETSTAKKPSPSLSDYDAEAYGTAEEDTIHSDDLVPRAERFINKLIVSSAVVVIDKLYEGREFPRFYALETVARVPYFSFLSVLHLYETLGFWRRADYLKVHFAQTMNEFHHLLIMEAMGGDKKFRDRFFAQHMAVAYYGMTCLIYLASPRMAYNLSEQVEAHAYHTYDEFLKGNEEELKATAPPAVAVKYYTSGDLFLFDEFQTGDPNSVSSANCVERRRPVIENLYDVFTNVRDDEAEHMKTMQFCQLPGTILRAPSETMDACEIGSDGELIETKKTDSVSSVETDPETDIRTCEGLMDCVIRAQDEPNWKAEKNEGKETKAKEV